MFQKSTVADDRNAFVLYGKAATLHKAAAGYMPKSNARVDWLARWPVAAPELCRWAEDNREALAVYRQGAERADARDSAVGLDRDRNKTRTRPTQVPEVALSLDSVERLLATLTVRKAALMIRHQTRQKRGGGRLLGESAFPTSHRETAPGGGLGEILSKEPTPDDAARFADAFDHLINKLQDRTLKTIALGKLKGHTSEEIGAELGTSARTVDRKLRLIRAIWKEVAG